MQTPAFGRQTAVQRFEFAMDFGLDVVILEREHYKPSFEVLRSEEIVSYEIERWSSTVRQRSGAHIETQLLLEIGHRSNGGLT